MDMSFTIKHCSGCVVFGIEWFKALNERSENALIGQIIIAVLKSCGGGLSYVWVTKVKSCIILFRVFPILDRNSLLLLDPLCFTVLFPMKYGVPLW